MTWFKVDDKFYSHRKVRHLSRPAIALWVLAGSYSADHLTDGVIQHSDIGWLGGTSDDVDELVTAGLWDEHPDGWEFHDWDTYQPTKVRIEERRAKERERIAEWREKQRNKSNGSTSYIPVPSRPSFAVTNGVSNGVTDEVPANPEHVSSLIEDLRQKAGVKR